LIEEQGRINRPFAIGRLDNKKFRMLIDSGASISIINNNVLKNLKKSVKQKKITLSDASNNTMKCDGTVDFLVKIGNREEICTF